MITSSFLPFAVLSKRYSKSRYFLVSRSPVRIFNLQLTGVSENLKFCLYAEGDFKVFVYETPKTPQPSINHKGTAKFIYKIKEN